MSNPNSTSSTVRTYGKRSATKRRQAADFGTAPSPAKRRKGSSEPQARTPSPTRTGEYHEVATNGEDSRPRPKVQTTYPPPRQPATLPHSLPAPLTPTESVKSARNLSRIFDSPNHSPSTTPTKLAKRMLARSKTESSLENPFTNHETTLGRAPSLPTITSSPSQSTLSSTSASKPVTPILTLLGPTSKRTATRTYAGQFRSFLVALPPSSSSSNPLSQNIGEEDGFDTRESYSSLCSRWGVDNSEDDPRPYVTPSPTKSSISSTPVGSPSRPSKGKSKSSLGHVQPISLPDGLMNPLKSISELRNKGESRQFLDEVGYLFEGMEKKGGIGLRRASALDITTKLCDPDFTRKAKAADFFSRTWDLFLEAGAGKGEDKPLDVLLIFFVALVARDSASLSELAERRSPIPSSPEFSSNHNSDGEDVSLVATVFRTLKGLLSGVDPLSLVANQSEESAFKKAGFDKKDRVILTGVHKTIQSKSNIFPEDVPISTSLLFAYTLQSLPPSFIPQRHLPTLLKSLQQTLSSTASMTLASNLILKWAEIAESLPYESVYYHLRLLDSYLLGQWGLSSKSSEQSQSQTWDDRAEKALIDSELGKARENWLVGDLITLGVCVGLKGVDNDSNSFAAHKCLDMVLRVLVSLTHANEAWSRQVLRSEYTMGFLMRTIHRAGQELRDTWTSVKQEDSVKAEPEEEALDQKGGREERADLPALDTLCLALGLLTNLVQEVDEAKRVVRETRLNPSCMLRKRACARKCACIPSSTGLAVLTDLYTAQQTPSEADPLPASTSLSANSLTPEAQQEAESSFLRGHLSVLFGLLMINSQENQAVILSALPAFSSSTQAASTADQAAKRAKLTRLVDQAKDFVAFYTVVSRKLDDGEKEGKVAKEVVGFLEALRDGVGTA